MFEFKKTSYRQQQKVLVRVWIAGILALLCFCALIARLWVLQVVRYDGLSERADQNSIAVVPIPPRRGEIVDRNGIVLARNYRDYTLAVAPAHITGSLTKNKNGRTACRDRGCITGWTSVDALT